MLVESKTNLIQSARLAIETELSAIQNLLKNLNNQFVKACELILTCPGRIIVTGIGKSGHIASKIAATLSSTGTPALFLHPSEASHGDLGMITSKDVVLAISNSGETREILMILPFIKRLGIPFITLTGNLKSTLAREATINIDVSIQKEACPLNLAPTASTTAALVMGDALAIALLEARGLTKEDFARAHPSGRLGRRLLVKIKDIMHTDDAVPQVISGTLLSRALLEVTRKSLGMTGVIDNDNKVIGIFTDGDLRRTLDRGINVHEVKIDDVMTKNCLTIKADMLAAESLQIMESEKINSFLVVDEEDHLIGAFNFLDLLHAGVT